MLLGYGIRHTSHKNASEITLAVGGHGDHRYIPFDCKRLISSLGTPVLRTT